MLFEAEAGRIRQACPDAVVEHVGSTAVRDLPAKPIIDVLVGVEKEKLAGAVSAVATLGYRAHTQKDRGDRIFLWLGEGDISRYHVNLTPIGSDTWRSLLDLRDLLRSDPRAREQYATAKSALAARHASDRAAYLEAKSAVVAELLERSRPG